MDAADAVTKDIHVHGPNAPELTVGNVLHCENDFFTIVSIVSKGFWGQGSGEAVDAIMDSPAPDRASALSQLVGGSCYYLKVERGMRNPVDKGTLLRRTDQLLKEAPQPIQQERSERMVEAACMNVIEHAVRQLVRAPEYIKMLDQDGELGDTSDRQSAFWNGIKNRLKKELLKVR